MRKKHFIFSSLLIAILIFSLLPITNYIADPSRVLHKDYLLRYKKFHQHELVLKTVYLIEHKNDYDTIVFGSSRGGFLDMSKIGPKAFNMSHGFGTASTYRHTLESLIDNGVRIKNVWIGLNDFDIWKDHSNEIHRLVYTNNLWKDKTLYSHWLFRFIPESINILLHHKELVHTNEVVKQEEHLAFARKQEKGIIQKLKHRHISAAPLGYNGKFRIDAAMKDIRAIKDLCDTHDINLTVFMYPSYYKTYLLYDQSQIERFKRELIKITDFYDFYDIGPIALDPHNWFEGSHFVPSVGDYIIESIHQHKHLVTAKNIDARIEQTRQYLYNMPILEDEDIYVPDPHTHIDTKNYKTIFDLYGERSFRYSKNDQFVLDRSGKTIRAIVQNTDPMIILDRTHTESTQVILLAKIKSPKESLFQIYYKPDAKSGYSENNSYKLALHKGDNTFKIIISGRYINHGIRVDFTRDPGSYEIDQFMIKEIPLHKK
jgi:hypothetical protein